VVAKCSYLTRVEIIHDDIVGNRADSVEPNGGLPIKGYLTLKSVRV